MRIFLLGATGSLGTHILAQARERGHLVTALLRDKTKLSAAPDLRLIEGDARNEAALSEAVAGQEAVIYSLGQARLNQPTTFFSNTTRLLLAQMNGHGVRRLVAVTGIGAGDSRGHGGWLYNWLIFPLFTRQGYEDKDRMEALTRASALDWVIVRPASFADGPRRGNLRALTDLGGVQISKIGRADAASFILDQLEANDFLHQSPLVGY
ncbi:MAG: hypothetical protein OHK0021_02700 [Bryobacter sp.]